MSRSHSTIGSAAGPSAPTLCKPAHQLPRACAPRNMWEECGDFSTRFEESPLGWLVKLVSKLQKARGVRRVGHDQFPSTAGIGKQLSVDSEVLTVRGPPSTFARFLCALMGECNSFLHVHVRIALAYRSSGFASFALFGSIYFCLFIRYLRPHFITFFLQRSASGASNSATFKNCGRVNRERLLPRQLFSSPQKSFGF